MTMGKYSTVRKLGNSKGVEDPRNCHLSFTWPWNITYCNLQFDFTQILFCSCMYFNTLVLLVKNMCLAFINLFFFLVLSLCGLDMLMHWTLNDKSELSFCGLSIDCRRFHLEARGQVGRRGYVIKTRLGGSI